MNLSVSPFSSLSPKDLYELLQLRSDVFIIEQNCIYRDLDDKDYKCHHLMGRMETGELVACSRLVPPGVSYKEPSIGRVATALKYRKHQLGRKLMQRSIDEVKRLYPNQGIRISAQFYLVDFYNSFGFIVQGESYDEDGLEHIEMLMP